MAKRDAHYAGQNYESDYPDPEDHIRVNCEVCGSSMVINNWPDKKKRTPKYKELVICPECDPRHPADRYLKKGYRVLHKRRVRITTLALIARAASHQPCAKGTFDADCRCHTCIARRLFPPF